MNPATDSPGARPRPRCPNPSCRARHPVSQPAPQPEARQALTSDRQTAPADISCSQSGIFSEGLGDRITATTRWASAKPATSLARASGSRPSIRPISAVSSANLAQAARSSTTKRQGSSLPWSGTRAAALQERGDLLPVRHRGRERLGRPRPPCQQEIERVGAVRQRRCGGGSRVGHDRGLSRSD
jgi:hypothetical protein